MSEVIMKRLLSLFFLCMVTMNLTVHAMQKKESYYDILGVPRDAAVEEITKAYRKLALKHHPDRGGDAEEFKKINQANEILTDNTKKLNYDYYLESAEYYTGDSFNPLMIYSKPGSTRNNGFDGNSSHTNNPFAGGKDPFEDYFANFFKKAANDRFNDKFKCHGCNAQTFNEFQSPCCGKSFYFCNTCCLNKKGIKCPGHGCPEIIIVIRNQYGMFEVKQTFECDGLACTKRTYKSHDNPCCLFGGDIYLCATCSTKSHVQCPLCKKNIGIESRNGTINLKKPVRLKKCSTCPNQIPDDTKSNLAPCCSGILVSLCRTCSAQPLVQCPRCNENIAIESRGNGLIKLRNTLKRCSACPNRIPVNTTSNYNPCCYGEKISLRNLFCSATNTMSTL